MTGSLKIETFSNVTGSNALFKALSHPEVQPKIKGLKEKLSGKKVALYDPNQFFDAANTYFNFDDMTNIEAVYCQDVRFIGDTAGARQYAPITDITAQKADVLFILAFDAKNFLEALAPILDQHALEVVTLDDVRLDESYLTDKKKYLNPLNFVTNFVFFRSDETYNTTLVTKNYWQDYGSKALSIAMWLFDERGNLLKQWRDDFHESAIIIDAKAIQKRFGLQDITGGQLFIHIIGTAGHDILKYALDVEGNDGTWTCTHDANSFPADYYAGLPAPRSDEKVIFWLQNTQPLTIPVGTIEFQVIGRDSTGVTYDKEVEPYGSVELDIGALMPDVRWPDQIEMNAKKYFVRPRYEVIKDGKRRMAHMNVERTDLKPDEGIKGLGNMLGKGFILPAPILDVEKYDNILLPTPMARSQKNLAFKLACYDASGELVLEKSLGLTPRDGHKDVNITALLKEQGKTLKSGYGHTEVLYDFAEGSEADGWMHSLFRYENRDINHQAETSFGGHIFNTTLTYKNEPQSYTGRAPGLRTKLFLRIPVTPGSDGFCQLIYAASQPWFKTSTTLLSLFNAKGDEVSQKEVNIPCGGSLLWSVKDMFGEDAFNKGVGGYVMIRDMTCRLFGYHGLKKPDGRFSLDHMFGF